MCGKVPEGFFCLSKAVFILVISGRCHLEKVIFPKRDVGSSHPSKLCVAEQELIGEAVPVFLCDFCLGSSSSSEEGCVCPRLNGKPMGTGPRILPVCVLWGPLRNTALILSSLQALRERE